MDIIGSVEWDFVEWYNSYQYGSKSLIRKVNNLPKDWPLPEKLKDYKEWEQLKKDFPEREK